MQCPRACRGKSDYLYYNRVHAPFSEMLEERRSAAESVQMPEISLHVWEPQSQMQVGENQILGQG
jgi:hypothetical protein